MQAIFYAITMKNFVPESALWKRIFSNRIFFEKPQTTVQLQFQRFWVKSE